LTCGELLSHQIQPAIHRLIRRTGFGASGKTHALGSIDQQRERPAKLGNPLVDQSRTQKKKNQPRIDTSSNQREKGCLSTREALA
jgi:hypothetical protein